jgi:predicted dehydrogenase
LFWRFPLFGSLGSAEAGGEEDLMVAMLGGQSEQRTFEHVDSLRVLLEAFADAVEGKAPFPVTPDQMLDVISAFEATLASMAKGGPVRLA